MNTIRPGIYKHYKGKLYQIFYLCRHTETEELLVCYQSLYDEFAIWVRLLTMFLEPVTIDGIAQPRFEYMHPVCAKAL